MSFGRNEGETDRGSVDRRALVVIHGGCFANCANMGFHDCSKWRICICEDGMDRTIGHMAVVSKLWFQRLLERPKHR